MSTFIVTSGPYVYPMLLLLGVILALSVINGVRLLRWHHRPDERVAASINSILFWGVICAVLGFLGQWTGIHRSMTVVSQATVVSPAAVAQGVAESLQTTILGLGVLLVAGVLWLGLSSCRRRLEFTRPGG
jgi:biopolymer transport protein ExbB/TolQ